MEIQNQLKEKLQSCLQLEFYLEKQVSAHTGLIASNEALLNGVPEHFKQDDFMFMQSSAILRVMKAELTALHLELQMAKLQVNNLKMEIAIRVGEGEAEV